MSEEIPLETPLSIDEFLSELKASLSESSAEAVLRRINAERLLRLLAEEFVDSQQAERVRILADRRLAGEQGADFLLQIDDYDIRLQFVDAPQGKPVIDAAQLPGFLKLLENNPSTVALVLIWTTDDLQAVPLSVSRIRFLLQNPDRLPALLASAQPLLEVLRTIVKRQVKLWEVSLDSIRPSTTTPTDMRLLFERAVAHAIEVECGRSYRQEQRKEAARRFPVEREKRLILEILGEAMRGVPASELVPRLVRVPRRGER